MPIQVRGVLVHAMSSTELSRVRTEFRLRLPEPINKSPLESSGADIVMQSCGVLVFRCRHTRAESPYRSSDWPSTPLSCSRGAANSRTD
jgi:hypothetical protein